MRKSPKTLKRVGLAAGVGTVVGLMPIVGLSVASASTPTAASLALSATTVGTTAVTATNIFTTTTAGATTITIDSLSAGLPAETAANSEQLPTAFADYSVSYTVGGVTTVDSPTTNPTGGPEAAVITLPTAIPAAAVVTVTISAVTNPTAVSSVYFSDATSIDTTAVDTNFVGIGTGTSAAATVTSVNPTAVPTAGPSPYTLMGTFFGSPTANTPNICFLPTVDAAPTAPSGCVAAGGVLQTTPPVVTATEIQGITPVLPLVGGVNTPYYVIVFNVNPAVAGTFQVGSAVSAATQLTSDTGLDFVPENGVRIADSRTGFNLPAGGLLSGITTAIPVSAILQSATLPSNIPFAATAVALNVTAIGPTGPGNLQVTAATAAAGCPVTSATTAEAGTSTVNFQPPQDTNNSTVVSFDKTGGPPATSDGLICVRDVGAPVQVTLDATGYDLGTFTTTQARLLDTRPTGPQVGSLQGPLPGDTTFSFNTGLAAGTTVALNVTAVGPTAPGNLRVFPALNPTVAPTTVPNTAVDNYIPGTDSGSLFITVVGYLGQLDLYSDSSGTTNVVVDEAGTFAGSHVIPVVTPYRVYDSRPAGIASGGETTVTAANSGVGSSFTPASAVASIGSLSDIAPAAQGYLSTFPAGSVVPNTASIANYPLQVRENLVFAATTNGAFTVFSGGAATNFTYDASAYIS